MLLTATQSRILIVEDENITAMELRMHLEEWGYEVIAIASSGDHAIRLAVEQNPDLVLMDINLKGELDGVETAEELQCSLHVPIIYMTAYSDQETLSRARITAPYGYVLKPFDERELRIVIEMTLYKHKAESELKRHRDHLEEMVTERTRELELSNQQLKQEIARREQVEVALKKAQAGAEAANLAKSRFLANVTHELKTPLNGILGYTQIMLQANDLSDRHRENVQIIDQAGQQLLMLINDILDLTKIESGQLKVRHNHYNFHWFIQQITDIYKRRCDTKEISFQVHKNQELPQYVQGDENRLRQVLFHLLDNAVKFTEQGSVTLSIEVLNGKMRFKVGDTGQGIPPDQFEKIFTMFSKSEAQSPWIEGIGFGLAVSKWLVKMMGGQLHVSSTPGQGSEFWFELVLPPGRSDRVSAESPLAKPLLTTPQGAMIYPPVSALNDLYQVAEIGDLVGIHELLNQIEQSDAQCQPFVEKMRQLARSFQLKQIKTMLDKVLHKS